MVTGPPRRTALLRCAGWLVDLPLTQTYVHAPSSEYGTVNPTQPSQAIASSIGTPPTRSSPLASTRPSGTAWEAPQHFDAPPPPTHNPSVTSHHRKIHTRRDKRVA